MSIIFTKLQATGNDFVLIDARELELNWTELAREMCDRHFGVGADGLILLRNSKKADFGMNILNADGSEAQVCGNGLRCFAKYVFDHRLYSGNELTISTPSGTKSIMVSTLEGKVNRARVNMGKPAFSVSEIPLAINRKDNSAITDLSKPILDYCLHLNNCSLSLSFVSMGNPHAVTFVNSNLAEFPLADVGHEIEHHQLFPDRINFEIARIISRNNIEVRVWERGAGETLACGSGACAVAVIAHVKGLTGDHVDIILPGGHLAISWDGVGDVYMEGPAIEVFQGEWP